VVCACGVVASILKSESLFFGRGGTVDAQAPKKQAMPTVTTKQLNVRIQFFFPKYIFIIGLSSENAAPVSFL
jgi:hypothetical protein